MSVVSGCRQHSPPGPPRQVQDAPVRPRPQPAIAPARTSRREECPSHQRTPVASRASILIGIPARAIQVSDGRPREARSRTSDGASRAGRNSLADDQRALRRERRQKTTIPREEDLVPKGDSNPHGLPHTPSNVRVCQFRHFGEVRGRSIALSRATDNSRGALAKPRVEQRRECPSPRRLYESTVTRIARPG